MNAKRFSLNSLNARLLLLVVALLAASFAGVAWYVSQATYKLSKGDQLENMRELAKSLSLTLDTVVRDELKLARVLAAQRAIVEALDKGADEGGVAQGRLKSYIEQYPEISSIHVFDTSGRTVAGLSASGSDERGHDLSRLKAATEILGGKAEAIDPQAEPADDGKPAYHLAAAVKGSGGRLLGGVEVAFDLGHLGAEHVDPFKIGESGYLYILDKNGRVLAHPKDKSLILKDLSSLPFVVEMIRQKNGQMDYEFKNEAKLAAFQEIPATGWVMAASATEAEMLASAAGVRSGVLTIAAGVSLALSLALFLSIRRMVVAPVTAMQRFTQAIAAGDYAGELSGSFSCELGELAANIRAMKASIKRELGFAKGVLNGIPTPCGIVGPDFTMVWANQMICDLLEKPKGPEAYIGEKSGGFYYNEPARETLSDKAIRTNERKSGQVEYACPSGKVLHVKVVTTPFYDMDGVILGAVSFWHDITDLIVQQRRIEAQRDKIAEAARQASNISERLSAAAEELSAQIEESSHGMDNQKNRISETATAVEQMNASILEVARNSSDAAGNAQSAQAKAQDGAQIVGDSVRAIEAMRARVDEMKGSLGDLGKQAEGIGTIIGIISDIADQTNLLALNAAIEAARAGDAGRGFAVVADEVRKLAEKTMTATKQVDSAISAIQNGTRKSVGLMDLAAKNVAESVSLTGKAGGSLREIVDVSVATADMVRSIATAAEEQSAASEQITRSTEEVSLVANETADAMRQSAQAVSEVARLAEELNTVIHDMQSA